MKIIIAGSRSFFDVVTVEDVMEPYLDVCDTVISGTARGADKCGEVWAAKHGIPVEQHPADWDKYGKSAGFRRNEEMAECGDQLVAFWDYESRGTEHMIRTMQRLGKPVTIMRV